MRAHDVFPPTVADELRLDRRRFLCAAASATVLVAGGEWLARRRGAAPPPVRRVALAAADLAVGAARGIATPDGADVLAVRLDADTVVAFDRRCPHLGCPVVWAAARERFECPCHRAAFDARTGRVLFGPPERGLAPVEVETA